MRERHRCCFFLLLLSSTQTHVDSLIDIGVTTNKSLYLRRPRDSSRKWGGKCSLLERQIACKNLTCKTLYWMRGSLSELPHVKWFHDMSCMIIIESKGTWTYTFIWNNQEWGGIYLWVGFVCNRWALSVIISMMCYVFRIMYVCHLSHHCA